MVVSFSKIKDSPFWFILIFKSKFPFIYITDEVNDFKFGMFLGFAKTHHKIQPIKRGRGPGLGEHPKNVGFPFNISAMADLKFGA